MQGFFIKGVSFSVCYVNRKDINIEITAVNHIEEVVNVIVHTNHLFLIQVLPRFAQYGPQIISVVTRLRQHFIDGLLFARMIICREDTDATSPALGLKVFLQPGRNLRHYVVVKVRIGSYAAIDYARLALLLGIVEHLLDAADDIRFIHRGTQSGKHQFRLRCHALFVDHLVICPRDDAAGSNACNVGAMGAARKVGG